MTRILAYLMFSAMNVFEILMFARAIMSWFPNLQDHPITQFVYDVTEPILGPIRALLMKIPPLRTFPLDFSIIAAFVLFEVLRELMAVLL